MYTAIQIVKLPLTFGVARSERFWLTVSAAAGILAMLPFVIFGIPDGYDLEQHLRFAQAYRDALTNGEFLPAWAAADNHGFGSVGIRFYPPFTGYLLALTDLLLNNWYVTLLINSVFWMVAGCVGLFYWARQFMAPPSAAAAAMLYAVMPYHLVQIYQFQLFSEFAAASILPFCFLFVTKLTRTGRSKDLLWLSVSVSLLILTHIPSGLIAAVGLGLYWACLIDWRKPTASLWKVVSAVGLSLLLTSFYWLRLVTELNWVKHSSAEFSSGFYDYQRHFFPIMLSFGDAYWTRQLWLLDIPIIITAVMLLPMALVVLYRIGGVSPPLRKTAMALLATGSVALVMLSLPSAVIWANFGGLQKIQFPWRFLIVASPAAAILFVLVIALAWERFTRYRKTIVYAVIALIFPMMLFNVTQSVLSSAPLNRERFEAMMSSLGSEEGCSCWWPSWADRSAFNQISPVDAGSRESSVIEWSNETRRIVIGPGAEGDARFATFYYPYWKAAVNGVSVPTRIAPDGSLMLNVDTGRSEVVLRFDEPYFVSLANWISLAAWAGVLLILTCLHFGLLGREPPTGAREVEILS